MFTPPQERPSVNDLLSLPLVQRRIERFLSEAERRAETALTPVHRRSL